MKGSYDMQRSAVRRKRPRTMKYYEFTLMILVLFTCAIGLVVIYSSSYYIAQNKGFKSTHFLFQQLKAVITGTAAMLILSFVNFKVFRLVFKFRTPLWLRRFSIFNKPKIKIKAPYLLLLISTILQIWATFFSEGANGAKRWIFIHSLGTIQPSEIAKFTAIIFGAYICYKYPKDFNSVKGFFRRSLPIFPLIYLIARENLSSAIIVTGIFFIICFVTTDRVKYFVGVGTVASALTLVMLKIRGGFRKERVDIFLNLEGNEKGQQILQGIYAIASGGLFGKGLGGSEQKYGRVPEAYNDMIYTIICEEFGLFGAIAIIILFIFIVLRILVIIMNTKDRFGALIGIGVISQIAVQVVLNIAVVTNFIPSTGVPLPFISYGGTAVMIMLCEIGVILNVSRQIEYRN